MHRLRIIMRATSAALVAILKNSWNQTFCFDKAKLQREQYAVFFIFSFLVSAFLSFDLIGALQTDVNLCAESAIMINGRSGKIIFEKNSRQKRYPASITKIATALYALKMKGNCLHHIITAEQDAIGAISPTAKKRSFYRTPSHWLETDSSHIGIKTGESMNLQDLLYGMMLMSGNDAANLIAQYVGGSIPNFMQQLNAYLKEIGCQDTHFVNPHGLHHPEHVSSAYDMALIARAALKYPLFCQIVATVHYMRPKTNKQATSRWTQGNKLLRSGAYFYPAATGIKTGYTSDAKHTFVGSAEKNGRQLIVVLLGCNEAQEKFADAIQLFEAAFAEKIVEQQLFDPTTSVFSCTLPDAATPIIALPAKEIKICYYPSEKPNIKAHLQWYDVSLPIHKAKEVGCIDLIDFDTKEAIGHYPLYAKERVEKSFSAQCQHFIKCYLVTQTGAVMGILAALCLFIVLLWRRKKH